MWSIRLDVDFVPTRNSVRLNDNLGHDEDAAHEDETHDRYGYDLHAIASVVVVVSHEMVADDDSAHTLDVIDSLVLER